MDPRQKQGQATSEVRPERSSLSPYEEEKLLQNGQTVDENNARTSRDELSYVAAVLHMLFYRKPLPLEDPNLASSCAKVPCGQKNGGPVIGEGRELSPAEKCMRLAAPKEVVHSIESNDAVQESKSRAGLSANYSRLDLVNGSVLVRLIESKDIEFFETATSLLGKEFMEFRAFWTEAFVPEAKIRSLFRISERFIRGVGGLPNDLRDALKGHLWNHLSPQNQYLAWQFCPEFLEHPDVRWWAENDDLRYLVAVGARRDAFCAKQKCIHI